MGKKCLKSAKYGQACTKEKGIDFWTLVLCLFYFWTPVLETIASYESAETAELNENGKTNQSKDDNEHDNAVYEDEKTNQTKDDNENDNAVYEDEKKQLDKQQRMIMITIMILMIIIMKMIILLMMMRKLVGPRSPGWRW